MDTKTTRLMAGMLAGGALLASAGVAEARRARAAVPTGGPLVLTSFVQNGRTDVKRNEPLVFKFSTLVRKGSVDARSLRVLQQTTSGEKLATGALITKGNVVRFDPTRTQRNYDDSRRPNTTVTEGDNPAGFASFTDYVIEVPAPPELHTLKNSRGQRITQAYGGQFRTSGNYFDPVPGQPYFVGTASTGNLGFDPPRSGSTGLVDEDAVILLEFSEPINIDTLDPSATVLVSRVLPGDFVPGFVRLDPNDRSGRKFQFVPSFGFGTDQANLAGWDIQVTLTDGITDLAGNPLKRPVQAPLFRTRYVAGKVTASARTETFSNQTYMDTSTVTFGGEWNTIEKGALRGGAATTYPAVDVNYRISAPGVTPVLTRQNDPLVTDQSQSGCFVRPFGSRAQSLYIPQDVGEAAAVVSVGWGPSSNALFGTIHDEITLQMGHTANSAVSADFGANYLGNPVQVFKGQYVIPQAKNIQPSDGTNASGVTPDTQPARGMWLWPIFTTPFEYNGVNNMIFDAACKPAVTCQILRGSFIPAGVPFPNRRAVGTNYTGVNADFTVDTVVYDARFNKRRRTTTAISNWYEIPSDTPQYGAPIVSPVGQPGGVVVLVEVEGANGRPDPNPNNPGGYIPNTATATGWQTDMSLVDNHRFFRFRVTMAANLATNQTARITSIQFPYQF